MIPGGLCAAGVITNTMKWGHYLSQFLSNSYILCALYTLTISFSNLGNIRQTISVGLHCIVCVIVFGDNFEIILRAMN